MSEADPLQTAVGTRLLFENEQVRVWDLQLAPGEAIPLHRHELDYLYVVIGDGRLQTEFAAHDVNLSRFLIRTSNPPKQQLQFTLDQVRYTMHLVRRDMTPSLLRGD